ncbi:MAG TPA: RecQ family ATP-dependent DNA helicase [Kofleriaceae bacterium]|jgi:ATP-dependent DNA helicase RecQ|nr:RecQ family ATP-dependent DNA helicase [Kofleriaceae bacterium]
MSALEILRDVFGHDAFRYGQGEAVEALLADGDALVLLPTGAGKSLCYQVPAIVRARRGEGTTIVISPLIALMNDQVSALAARGVAVAALHSQCDESARAETIGRLMRGELALLYVSPERAVQAGFKRLLGRARIAMIAIDEAHCVSQWGHDFRPEYMRLAELRAVAELATAPMIALTATATPRVLAEITHALELRKPTLIRGDFRRPNLAFEVLEIGAGGGGNQARLAATISALERAGLRQRTGAGRAIVYCSTRKTAEEVAASLKHAGFAAGHYHAGRTALARERAQSGFSVGRMRVLVATNAFGMGVDYPDVRVIVHFQAPGSVEAYYQEAGRAGRDGAPAHCLLLFGAGDLMTQRRIAQHGATGKRLALLEESLSAVAAYATVWTCRQRMLCAHFIGTDDNQPACGLCDACLDPAGEARPEPAPAAAVLGSAQQQIILAAIAAHGRAVAKGTLAKALRGSEAKPVVVHGLDRLAQHGALEAFAEADIAATIESMVQDRRLVRRGRKYPTVAVAGPAKARAPRTANARRGRDGSRASSITVELDRYRTRMARQLRWKAFMVFQRNVIVAIDRHRPDSLAALARIPGLGANRIARFGDDLIAIVRRYGGGRAETAELGPAVRDLFSQLARDP